MTAASGAWTDVLGRRPAPHGRPWFSVVGVLMERSRTRQPHDRYDARAIERKWQELWEREGTWEVPEPGRARVRPGRARRATCSRCCPTRPGEPHIGHLKNYSMGDVLAHYRRRHGMRVLHPMGYDAFGLPAENHAIKHRRAPGASRPNNSIEEFRRQFRSWGVSIDWRREFGTHEPALLPLDAVDLPEALRARARLPQARAGQVVPERPDRARQRAGDRRRAASAAARRSWCSHARAVVLQDHRLRRPPAGGLQAARVVAAARDHDAAQLDRPLRGRGGRLPAARSRRSTSRSSRPGRTRCSARPSSCSRPSIPTSSGWWRAREHGAARCASTCSRR